MTEPAPVTAIPAHPIEQVLGDLRIPALPEGATARELLALVKLEEPGGGISWSVRVTSGLNDEEILGVLVGYVEHLRQEAAAEWDDRDPTRSI